MSNPSLVWAQLAIPNPPIGSVPFVYTDGATIITDVTQFKYIQTGDINIGTSGYLASQLLVANGLLVDYGTAAVGSFPVINNIAGRLMIPAAASFAVVTNNKVFATSIIIAVIEGAIDATATRVQVTAQSNGSFTLTTNAAATGNLAVSFIIINVF